MLISNKRKRFNNCKVKKEDRKMMEKEAKIYVAQTRISKYYH